MTDVFISHAKADRKLIRRLAKALEAEGLDVWWEQNNSADGKWTPALQRALVDSAAIIVAWTEESVASQWVKAEASHGRDRNAVLCVRFGDCKIPAEFKEIPSPDFTKWRNDEDDPDWVRIITRVRALIKAKSELGAQPPAAPGPFTPGAPPRAVAQAAPQQAAAQVVAPSAFFSANLGNPTARAQPAPPAPPPRAAPQPRPAPPPQPSARTFQPIDDPAPAPTRLRPVEPSPAPPPRPMRAPPPPTAPPARLFEPVDAPPPRRAPERESERESARNGVRERARERDVVRQDPPPRERPSPAPARRRRGPGAAQIVMGLVLLGVIGGGVYWGADRFLSAPSAPSLAENASGAPEPLPIEPPTPQTQIADAGDLPPIEEDAVVEEAAAPPAAPVVARPPAAAPARPPAQQPAAQPPATAQSRPQQLVLQGASAPDASPRSDADVMRDLERCLGRLVRQCPGANGVARPGFSEDGSLSSAERALLRQRSLFAFSEVMDTNLVNCQRHLGAASAGAHEPLTVACRGLPASGPPR
ncbi:MAG: TIR domain-containing protein [Alphaproteobacteria bacterium]|nr:TIR domain-containing protein [Alphaproteobacteria bacterium]